MKGGEKALFCIRQNNAAIDILWYFLYGNATHKQGKKK